MVLTTSQCDTPHKKERVRDIIYLMCVHLNIEEPRDLLLMIWNILSDNMCTSPNTHKEGKGHKR